MTLRGSPREDVSWTRGIAKPLGGCGTSLTQLKASCPKQPIAQSVPTNSSTFNYTEISAKLKGPLMKDSLDSLKHPSLFRYYAFSDALN
jgi:hypothetical protein